MTHDLSGAVRPMADGVLLLLEVTPGAKASRFPAGFDPWRERIGIRVQAPPEGGQANREVCAVLAAHFGIAAAAVAVRSGHRSRQKTVALDGVTQDHILRLLREAVA